MQSMRNLVKVVSADIQGDGGNRSRTVNFKMEGQDEESS